MNFLKFFPLPNFLRVPAFGIDISDRSFKYAKLSKSKTGLCLEKFGEENIPKGLIVGGEIKKKEDLISFLKKVWKNSGIEYAVVSLPEEKAFSSVIDFPFMREDEIGVSLEAQLEEYVPLNAKNAVFDFEIIGNSKNNNKLDISITAFPRGLVEDYKEVLVKSGFKPVIFEPEANAISRSVLKENDRATKMIVDFGKTRTGIIIVNNNRALFTSTIKTSGEDLNKAIARSFSVEEDEAEEIKKKQGFIQTGEHSEVYSIILPIIAVIEEEIKKYFSYWQTHYTHIHKQEDSAEINEIILCGGDANLIGVAEYLSYKLNKPVKKANVWINIDNFDNYIPEIEFNQSLTYSTVLGLALKGLKMGYL